MDLPHTKIISPWLVPPPVTLKFNCDIAVDLSFSSIVVVARDWKGKVVLALSKKVNTTIPLQAEEEAIFWATSIAVDQWLNRVCFESDSKTFMDCLSSSRSDSHWRISCSMSQVRSLASSHPSWSFKWVCREANSAPHALASWSFSCYSWGLFNFCNSPTSFVQTCM